MSTLERVIGMSGLLEEIDIVHVRQGWKRLRFLYPIYQPMIQREYPNETRENQRLILVLNALWMH